MAEGAIHEWIQDWQNIKPLDIKGYAANLMADRDVTSALLRVFEDPSLHHLLDCVCGQLLTFYRSREPNLVHFSLQCLPLLMHTYLNAVAVRNRLTCKSTEALLLGMYNLEVVDERGQPRVISFRMPTLIKQSVYHEPLHMAPSSLTEHSLSRLELGDAFSVEWGPLPQASRVHASNRQRILTALMTVYNRHLSHLTQLALHACCRAVIRICGQGFHHTAPPLTPRLTVSPELQLEFLHAIYFIITPALLLDPRDPAYTFARYEEMTPAATQALEAVAFRGQYEVNARVTLAAAAMRNSLDISPAGLTDSQLNLTEVPSVTSQPSVNKYIITNASFRTKKLPDDIEPPPDPGPRPAGPPAAPAPVPAAAAAAAATARGPRSPVRILRAGIRRIRHGMRRRAARTDPDTESCCTPEESQEGLRGPDGVPLRGTVSTDSFEWSRPEAAAAAPESRSLMEEVRRHGGGQEVESRQEQDQERTGRERHQELETEWSVARPGPEQEQESPRRELAPDQDQEQEQEYVQEERRGLAHWQMMAQDLERRQRDREMREAQLADTEHSTHESGSVLAGAAPPDATSPAAAAAAASPAAQLRAGLLRLTAGLRLRRVRSDADARAGSAEDGDAGEERAARASEESLYWNWTRDQPRPRSGRAQERGQKRVTINLEPDTREEVGDKEWREGRGRDQERYEEQDGRQDQHGQDVEDRRINPEYVQEQVEDRNLEPEQLENKERDQERSDDQSLKRSGDQDQIQERDKNEITDQEQMAGNRGQDQERYKDEDEKRRDDEEQKDEEVDEDRLKKNDWWWIV